MATPQKPQHQAGKAQPKPGSVPVAQKPPVTQPKILRIGIIQGGRIVEERLIHQRVPVTVGQSAKNTFVVPSEALPRSFVMFEVTPKGYALNFTAQMDGRISLGDAVIPLPQLQARSQQKPGGIFQLPLTENSRGKVIAGDMTLLFQFVTPPPKQPRPQLPPSVRGGFSAQVDATMASILSISAIIHAAFFVYLLAFVEIPKEVDIEEEFRQFQKVFAVKVKPPEQKKLGGMGDGKKAEGEAGKQVAKKTTGKPGRVLSAEERARAAKAAAEARIARARGEAAKVGILAVLTARGSEGGGSAFGDALAGGGAQSDLDRAMKSVGGVTVAGSGGGGGLASVGGGGGGGGGRITSVADLTKAGPGKVGEGGGGTGVKVERKVKITGGKIDDVSSGDLDVDAANATIKRGYAGIKNCYDRGLKKNPKLKGKITVRIVVTGAGTVGNVSVQDDTLGDPEVVACMLTTIRGWRFPPAQGGKAEIEPSWVFMASE